MPRKKVTPAESTLPGGGTPETPGKATKPQRSASRPATAAEGSSRQASVTTGKPHEGMHEGVSSRSLDAEVSVREQIALLAYSYWESRGRHGGSPEDDWYRAEREIRSRNSKTAKPQ